MGMIVNVYRADRQDCTNGGMSANANRLCVVNVDGPFDPDEDTPAAILTTNAVGNPVIMPAKKGTLKGIWLIDDGFFMMGGNYAATSDSRFSSAIRKRTPNFYGAIPIHDRQE